MNKSLTKSADRINELTFTCAICHIVLIYSLKLPIFVENTKASSYATLLRLLLF
ncbi:MAG: hypothetical protein IJC83_06040 [Oscillospiraceae bacterium]|nr:hypothetical protein [Oscillospiraceae bacterium]